MKIFPLLLVLLFVSTFINTDEYRPRIYDIKYDLEQANGEDFILNVQFKTDVPCVVMMCLFPEQNRREYHTANDFQYEWFFEERIVEPQELFKIMENVEFDGEKGISFGQSYYQRGETIYNRYFHGSYMVDTEMKRVHEHSVKLNGLIRYYLVVTASDSTDLGCFSKNYDEELECLVTIEDTDLELMRCIIISESYNDIVTLPISAMYSSCDNLANYKTIQVDPEYTPLNPEDSDDEEYTEHTIIEAIGGLIFVILLLFALWYIFAKRLKR